MSVSVETSGAGLLEVRAGEASLTVDRLGHGGAATFRSVDLLAAALGSCMVGTMLSFAQDAGVRVESVKVELKPVLAVEPERVKRIRAAMTIRGEISNEQMSALRVAAESCKVHNSLHRGVDTELTITLEAIAVTENV